MTFTKHFIRDASLGASSLNLTVSLIKDTECTMYYVPIEETLLRRDVEASVVAWHGTCKQPPPPPQLLPSRNLVKWTVLGRAVYIVCTHFMVYYIRDVGFWRL